MALLESAPKLPFIRVVRVDGNAVRALVDELQGTGARPELLRAAEAVRKAVREARPVALSDEVRLPPETVARLVAGLRATGA